MSELKEYQFDKITKFIDYRGKTPVKTEEGIPLITAKNIKFGYLSDKPKEFISKDDYDDWMSRGIPNKGDILFTTEAPLGNVCILNTNEKRAFAQRTIVFQPLSNDVYISNYLFYYLMSPIFIDELDSKKTGTTVYGIKSSILKKFKIPLPPLEEQKRIVDKLDNLFAKIDKAIALHQKNIDEANVFMASVLNDVFVELEEKYPKIIFDKVCNKITDGSHNPPKGIDNSQFMMLSSKNIFNNSINFENPRYLKEEDFNRENKRTDVTFGDVLLTIVGTIGRTAVVNIEEKFTLQRSVAVLKPKKNLLDSYFLMYSLQKNLEILIDGAKGAAQKGIYLNSVKQLEIVDVSLKTQQKVVSYLDEISQKMEKIKQIQKEKMQSLKALKASILDQAFKGEL